MCPFIMSKIITCQALSEDIGLFSINVNSTPQSSDIYLSITFLESRFQTGWRTSPALEVELELNP